MSVGVLLLFARTPRLGHGKTRLAADVGRERALAFQEAALGDLLDEHAAGPVPLVVQAADPDFDVARFTRVPVEVRPQEGPDLGARLAAAFAAFPGPVVVIGSDLPTVTRADVALAFRLLKAYDLVLGPASDGGYWLLGARTRGDLFSGVPWSTPDVLNVTLDRARNLAWTVSFLDTRTDVDTGADLAGLLGHARLPPRTAKLRRMSATDRG